VDVGQLARRPLGRTGIEVSVVGLGGNTFGPPRLDEAQTKSVVSAALDLGVNFVDTANVYGQGHSEEFLARALGGRRDEMVIATKFNFRMAGDGSAGERIVAQAEASLRRLETERIDLYQLHFPDPDVPVDDILAALDQLVRDGKVRAIGVCNYSSWRLAESAAAASATGSLRFATVQNYYHLLARQAESEVAPYCSQRGMSLLPYHPLAGGFLTGKYHEGRPPPAGSRGAAGSGIVDAMATPANYVKLAALETFCAERHHTVGELAIAWLIANPVVASVIAGVSSPAQLVANVGAASWLLTPDELSELDQIVTGPGGVASPERPPYAARG